MLLNRFLSKIGVCIAMVLIAGACTKEDPVVNDPGNDPIDPDAPRFSWTIDGGTKEVADSAAAYEQSHVIFVFKYGGGSIEIILSDMAAGEYLISTATGNQLTYTLENATYETSGTVYISSSSSNKISGSFDCSFKDGPYSTISGEFSNIPKR